MKIFLALSLLTIVNWHNCYCQIEETFSDADFTNAPSWHGDESKFAVLDGQLKLTAQGITSTAFMSTQSTAVNNASWEVLIRMDFNPSSTNFSKIYLISDQPDLSNSLNGYFVKIGQSTDEVSLYRQEGITEIKIIDGLDKRLDFSKVSVKIKVLRDDVGNWHLYSDVGAKGEYALEGSVIDNTYLSCSFFGLSCKYTASRSEKFYFDDITVTGSSFIDIISPELEDVKVISHNQLDVKFSESLDSMSAVVLANYDVNNGLGNPVSAALFPDRKTVRLAFSKDFLNRIECLLYISGVKDAAGNTMIATEKNFVSFHAEAVAYRDIIITEIFADPSPQVGLPSLEYIELFNRSSNPVDLSEWVLSDGNSNCTLSSKILFPYEYLIIADQAGKESLNNFGPTMGVDNFITLNNNGDAITIKGLDGVVIDSVNYADTWYKDDDKKAGGWSLELIDPNNICGEINNWLASQHANGGTPGKQNSVYESRPDRIGPKLLSAIPTSANIIMLKFDEKLENKQLDLSAFVVKPKTEIAAAKFLDTSLTTINILLVQDIQANIMYTISTQKIYDCAGNTIESAFNTVDFGLPRTADSLDIVVNEILFNPRPTGTDFVEIYNNSSSFINLKNYALATMKDEQIKDSKVITATDFLLKPFSYLVLSQNGNVLKGEYVAAHEENFLEVDYLPSFNDDEGSVVLLDDKAQVIDYFAYSEGMHSVFLKDEEGVSLERLGFDESTNEIQNWKSASSNAGFATPGYRNSNVVSSSPLQDESVTVEPEIFIPVYGQPNFTLIQYKLEQGGYMANIIIYDTQGHEIKQVANNELLSADGFFRWDGDQNNGSKARMGYYVITFEIFNSTGLVKTFRKRVAIVTEF